MPISTRQLKGVLAGLAVTLAVPAAANAACAPAAVSQPFAQFGDHADYRLAPGGAFEAGMSPWALNGSSTVAGNESFFLRDAGDARSLQLPKRTSAVSPAFCVSAADPTMRLTVRRLTGAGRLKVEIIHSGGKVTTAGVFEAPAATGAWAPSPILPLASLLPAKELRSAGSMDVQLRVTAGSGTWQVDDVYIDPRALRVIPGRS